MGNDSIFDRLDFNIDGYERDSSYNLSDEDKLIFSSMEYTDIDDRWIPDGATYTQEAVERAIEWCKVRNIFMILPVEYSDDSVKVFSDLDEQLKRFNDQYLKLRRESDWTSLELFDMGNIDHYNYLKEQYSLFFGLSELQNESTVKEDSLSNSVVNDDDIDLGISPSIISTPYVSMPFFTPEEMIDLGVHEPIISNNYFGEKADNDKIGETTTDKWLEQYCYGFNNHTVEDMSAQWTQTLKKLYRDFDRIKESGDIHKINARKQSILELGWNPEIDFNDKNIRNSNRRLKTIMESMAPRIEVVDFLDPINESDNILTESPDNVDELHPVYICLFAGNSLLSKSIMKFSDSEVSHSGISLDASFRKMNSMGSKQLYGDKKSIFGGLSEEDITKRPGDDRLCAYVFFVKDAAYKAITDMLDFFKKSYNKIHYSVVNLIGYLFGTTVEKNKGLICSQFVHKILQAANIDFGSKKPGDPVSPGDFKKTMDNYTGKVYKVYDGKSKDYNPTVVKRKTTILAKKSEALVESNSRSAPAYIRPINEFKKSLFSFTSKGDLVLNNKDLNIEKEFHKCNSMLKIYFKNSDTNNIKYELAKLWMLKSITEQMLENKSLSKSEYKKLIDSRARIINIFNYYMDRILLSDKSFNFTKYYESTPFSSLEDSKWVMDANTVEHTAALLRSTFTNL